MAYPEAVRDANHTAPVSAKERAAGRGVGVVSSGSGCDLT